MLAVLLVSVDGWGAEDTVYGAPTVTDDSLCVYLGDLAQSTGGDFERVYWLCLGVGSPE
jgi:hypothetical protein